MDPPTPRRSRRWKRRLARLGERLLGPLLWLAFRVLDRLLQHFAH